MKTLKNLKDFIVDHKAYDAEIYANFDNKLKNTIAIADSGFESHSDTYYLFAEEDHQPLTGNYIVSENYVYSKAAPRITIASEELGTIRDAKSFYIEKGFESFGECDKIIIVC